jgi:hypothetical protein
MGYLCINPPCVPSSLGRLSLQRTWSFLSPCKFYINLQSYVEYTTMKQLTDEVSGWKPSTPPTRVEMWGCDSVCLFLFSYFYWSDLRLRLYVSLANLWWNIDENQNWKLGVSLFSLWLLKAHFYYFLNWMHRFSQICSLLREKYLEKKIIL